MYLEYQGPGSFASGDVYPAHTTCTPSAFSERRSGWVIIPWRCRPVQPGPRLQCLAEATWCLDFTELALLSGTDLVQTGYSAPGEYAQRQIIVSNQGLRAIYMLGMWRPASKKPFVRRWLRPESWRRIVPQYRSQAALHADRRRTVWARNPVSQEIKRSKRSC